MASLEFIMPLLLPVIVALLAAAVASADRDWGILRYLYVAPITRTRLLSAKLAAVAIATTLALACVLAASILNGQSALHAVAVVLPVHYWQNWAGLFEPDGATDLGTGSLAQLATAVLCTAVSLTVLRRRDPAA